MAIASCRGCGTAMPDNGEDYAPTPEHCPNCPPSRCESCGGICDWQTGTLCSCFIDISGMSVADVKAVFIEDCDCHDGALSLDPAANGEAGNE